MSVIPDELWPDVLPMVRVPSTGLRARHRTVWINTDEILLAKTPQGGFPATVFTASGNQLLRKQVPAQHLAEYKIADIQSLRLRPLTTVYGEPKCVLRIKTAKRSQRALVSLGSESAAADALGRLLGDRLVIGRRARSPGYWALSTFLWLVIGVISLFAAASYSADWEGHRFYSGVLAVGTTFYLTVYLLFRWRRRVATNPPPDKLPALAPIRRIAYHSARLGWALKAAGFAACALALVYTGSLTTLFVKPEPGNLIETICWTFTASCLLYLLLSIPGLALLYLGYLIGQPNGSAILKADPRPRILYLRSFGDDARRSFNRASLAGGLLGVMPLFAWIPSPFRFCFNLYPLRLLRIMLNRNLDSAEEQLVRVVSKYGPLVTLGKPNERFSTPGMPRVYLGHDNWQQMVREMIDAAPFVILQPAATEGIWWELQEAVKRLDSRRLLICLCGAQTPDELDFARVRLNRTLPKPIAALQPGQMFIWFERDWTPRAEYLPYYSPFTWPLRGTTANLSQALERFFANWRGEAVSVPPPPMAVLPPRPHRLQAAVAATVFLALQFGVGALWGGAKSTVLAPSSASLMSDDVKTISGSQFTMQLNAGWKELEAHGSLAGKGRFFQAGPNYALEVVPTLPGRRNELKSGVDEYFRGFGQALAQHGFQEPTLRCVSTEVIGQREWLHAEICGTRFFCPLVAEIWLTRSVSADFTVALYHPQAIDADDAVVRSVRQSLGTYEHIDPNIQLIENDHYSMRLRGSWQSPPPVIASLQTSTFGPYFKSYEAGPDYALLIATRMNQARLPHDLVAVEYFTTFANDLVSTGEASAAKFRAADVAQLESGDWLHGSIDVTMIGNAMVTDVWVRPFQFYDVVVQLIHPACAGPRDDIMCSVREMLESFQYAPPKQIDGTDFTMRLDAGWQEMTTLDLPGATCRKFVADPNYELHFAVYPDPSRLNVGNTAAEFFSACVQRQYPGLAASQIKFITFQIQNRDGYEWRYGLVQVAIDQERFDIIVRFCRLPHGDLIVLSTSPESAQPDDPFVASCNAAMASIRMTATAEQLFLIDP